MTPRRRLNVDFSRCVACGICEDVCGPRALRLVPMPGPRGWDPRPGVQAAGALPRLADPDRCDGDRRCVEECPAGALELREVP